MSDFENDYQKKKAVQMQFHTAFNLNDCDTVEELLSEGKEFYPNINERLISNYPIFISLCDDNLEMLNILFQAGAELDVASENGWHFSHELATKPTKLVGKILPYVSLAVNLPDGTTPLMVAAQEEKWETVDLFLSSSNSLRVYSQNSEGDSVAHILAKKGQVALLNKLIDSREDAFEAFVKNNEGKLPSEYIQNEATVELLENRVALLKENFEKKIYPEGEHFTNDHKGEVVSEQPVQVVPLGADAEEVTEPKVAPKKMGLGGIKKNF